jgi:hypothetical protein
MWAAVLEKAFAKLHGSYEALEGGHADDALNYLCGGHCKKFDLTVADAVWEQLTEDAPLAHPERASFLSCSLNPGICADEAKARGLFALHAYSLLGVLQTSGGVRLLKLRNPHGGTEWNGAFSDGSSEWTAELKAEVEEICHHELLSEDDGSFFMEFEDFLHYMGEIGSCTPFMVTAGEHHDIVADNVVGCWVAGETAGGPRGLGTFRFNPSYRFVPSDPSVTITFSQLDQRGHTAKLPWMDAYLHLLEADHYAALSEGGAKSKETLKPLKPLVSLSNRLASVDVAVSPGDEYTLIPAAHSAGVEGHYCISIASRHGVQLAQLAPGGGVRPTATDSLAMAHHPSRAASCYVCRGGFEPHQSFYEFPEGRVHSAPACKEAYYEETSAKCLVCRKALLPGTSLYTIEEGQVHAGECYDKFSNDRAPKCCECKSPLLGAFYRVKASDDGVEQRVCAEGDCHSKWQERTADKCLVCGAPVLGGFYDHEEGKVHSDGDCWQKFCEGGGDRQ